MTALVAPKTCLPMLICLIVVLNVLSQTQLSEVSTIEQISDTTYVLHESKECLVPKGSDLSCTPCDNEGLTIGVLYFNEVDFLTEIIREFSTWATSTKQACEIMILDDGSDEEKAAVTVIRELCGAMSLPPIRIVTVKDHLTWNIGGARNLLMQSARKCQVVMMDNDYLLHEDFASEMIKASIPPETIYRLKRDHIGKSEVHPGIMFTTRVAFFSIGGADEDFVGHYGSTDPHIVWRAREMGVSVALFPSDGKLQPQTEKYRPSRIRDASHNLRLFESKKNGELKWSDTYLRFQWDDAVLDCANQNGENQIVIANYSNRYPNRRLVKPILIYSFQGKEGNNIDSQLTLALRSAWSAYDVGCETRRCRQTLQVHIYVDTMTKKGHDAVNAFRFHGLDINIHEVNFNDLVGGNYTVWGPYSAKLSLKANYFRFYAPNLLKDETELFLYVDTDTLFLNGGLDQLFSTPLLTPIASGVQNPKNCWFGKIINLNDDRVKNLNIDNQDSCLTASVLLVNITAWNREDMTKKVETWLTANTNEKLWDLGSMPPLMLAAHGNWKQLTNIYDSKGHDCKTLDEITHSGALIAHPFKDDRCAYPPDKPIVLCHPEHDQLIDVNLGSKRVVALRVEALAQLLGASVQSTVSDACSIVFSLENEDRNFWVRIGYKHSDEVTFANAVEVDNMRMYQQLRMRGEHPILFHHIEKVPDNTPLHRVRTLTQNDTAILCYHGNAMHIQSILPHLKQLKLRYRLRIIGSVLVDTSKLKTDLARAEISYEWIDWELSTLHYNLHDCDVGLVPQEVYSTVDEITLAKNTASNFLAGDIFDQDTIRRCKGTSNIGRQAVFIQLGVPTLVDGCFESIRHSSWKDEHIVQLVAFNKAWPHVISTTLLDVERRRMLSKNSLRFAHEYLTLEHEARRYLNQLSVIRRYAARDTDLDVNIDEDMY